MGHTCHQKHLMWLQGPPKACLHAMHGLNFAWGELRTASIVLLYEGIHAPSLALQHQHNRAHCTLPPTLTSAYLHLHVEDSLATSLAHETDTYIITHVIVPSLPPSPPHTYTHAHCTCTLAPSHHHPPLHTFLSFTPCR